MGARKKKEDKFSRVILIPVDFSVVAESALEHGAGIARTAGSSMCLLHVYDLKTDTIFNKEDPACILAIRQLTEYKEQFEAKHGLSVETLIKPGNLFKALNGTVKQMRPFLMVMGTHGKQGLQHLFGSHALRVVLDVDCPVLVVQDKPREEGYRQMVVPVDNSTDPSGIIPWVQALSGEHRADIHLLQAMEPDPERNEAIRTIAARISRAAREICCQVQHNTAGTKEDFARQVIDYSAVCKADLILTMTTPATTATGYMLSDWNERLMFNPHKIPVLFVDQGELPG